MHLTTCDGAILRYPHSFSTVEQSGVATSRSSSGAASDASSPKRQGLSKAAVQPQSGQASPSSPRSGASERHNRSTRCPAGVRRSTRRTRAPSEQTALPTVRSASLAISSEASKSPCSPSRRSLSPRRSAKSTGRSPARLIRRTAASRAPRAEAPQSRRCGRKASSLRSRKSSARWKRILPSGSRISVSSLGFQRP